MPTARTMAATMLCCKRNRGCKNSEKREVHQAPHVHIISLIWDDVGELKAEAI